MNCVTRVSGVLWGIYSWLCFAAACLFALLAALIVPGAGRREKLANLACRSVFVMSRVRVNIRGIDNLPAASCVVVANHASYVDGVLLKGYLPAHFGFVIKGEMRNYPIVHFLLRRSGAKFVERNEVTGSSRDARQLVKAAQDGESLGFFPEGTFRLERGIGRFHAGAFVAAIKGDMPVVPIAISGTREMLPAGRLLPQKTELLVNILPAIGPDDPEFADSRSLAEASRQRILATSDEPDLQEPLNRP